MHKVLFVHTGGGIGDLLLSSPILAAVKRTWPRVETTCWVNPRHAPILDGHPSIDACLPGEAPWRDRLRVIRRGGFDAAILPWTTGREAWLAYLGGVPRRVGQAGRLAYSFLFTDPVRVRSAAGDVTSHWVDIQLDYARALGCATDGLSPEIRLRDEDRAAASVLLAAHGLDRQRLCAFHVGKGVPMSLARWPIDRFVEIGRRIRDRFGLQIVLTGSAAEGPVVDAVAAGIGSGAINLAGATPIRTLCGLIARCDVLICPDSGPMHIAAALGVPVVGIFALRTDVPARWRPWSARSRVIRSAARNCRPDCVKERCPRFACLEEIDVAEVSAAVAELLCGPAAAHAAARGRPA